MYRIWPVLIGMISFWCLLRGQESPPLQLVNRFPAGDSLVVQMVHAAGIDIDVAGNIYIVDQARHQLFKFSGEGELIKVIGGFGRDAEQFTDPRDVFAHSTLDVYVADYNNNRVVRYDKNLNFLSALTSEWPEPYRFDQVLSVALSPQLDLFILEDGAKRIIKFDRFGQPTAAFGGINETFGQLLEPVQLAVGGTQQVFVSDPGQQAVVVFDYLGNYLTAIMHPRLQRPWGLHWGDDEKLYVVDHEDGEIFVFSPRFRVQEVLSLAAHVNEVVDVAVGYHWRSRTRRLYVLAPDACWVFEGKSP